MQEIVNKQKSNNNSKYQNDNCSKYLSTAMLHHKEILNSPKKIDNLQTF